MNKELDNNQEDPVELWAEIHRLRAELYPPEGYLSWKECAVKTKAELGTAKNLLVFALYCNQGSTSMVGQAIRKFFGLSQNEPIPEKMLKRMKNSYFDFEFLKRSK